LPPADLALLTPHLRRVAFEPGMVLQEAEAPVENVYFPLSGMISLVVAMTNGFVVETAVVGREGTIGAFAGLGPWNAFSRAVVQFAGTGLAISAARFQEAVSKSDALRAVVLGFKENLLGQVQQTAACNAVHSLESRMARWLLQAHDRADGPRLNLTQDVLSHMLGVRRTTVTLSAGLLQGKGLIKNRRGSIEIIDRGRLEAAACECYAALRRRARPSSVVLERSNVG
jgi:CRP-like cAMP-binding protein